VTVPAIGVPPSASVNVVPDTPITFSLNCAVTVELVATAVAPGIGVRAVTVGAVVSAAVVNVQVFWGSEAPPESTMLFISVAVYVVLGASCAVGVSVATGDAPLA